MYLYCGLLGYDSIYALWEMEANSSETLLTIYGSTPIHSPDNLNKMLLFLGKSKSNSMFPTACYRPHYTSNTEHIGRPTRLIYENPMLANYSISLYISQVVSYLNGLQGIKRYYYSFTVIYLKCQSN